MATGEIQFIIDPARPDYGKIVNAFFPSATDWGPKDFEFPLAIREIDCGDISREDLYDNRWRVNTVSLTLEPLPDVEWLSVKYAENNNEVSR